MHADQLGYVSRFHEGVVPRTWLTGDLDYQKAKVIAALAWHFTKDPEDPELKDCDLTHQESRTGVVEGIMRGAFPSPTDPPFDQAAYKLYLETLPNKENRP